MMMKRLQARISLAVLCMATATMGFSASTTRLEVAAQTSLSDNLSLVLIFSDAVASSAGNISYYTLTPSRVVTSAVIDAEASNVVHLKLDSSTPLEAGTAYTIEVTGGTDRSGEILDPALTSGTLTGRSLQGEVNNILATQIPDGAFSTNVIGDRQWRNGEPLRLVPYYGCIAAQGLIQAFKVTRDQELLDQARAYLEWHADHIPVSGFITDYVGWYPTYQSTGTYDSTDSYAALFALTLWKYYQATQDIAVLQSMYPALEKSVAAIDATLQPDNLTWATPDYKVKFTMDNAEVFQGFYAAAQLARAYGNTSQQALWQSRATAVKNAIHSNLYLDEHGRYSKGKSNAGTVYTTWSDYYPDAMANDFALYYTHLPGDAEFVSAWDAEKAEFFPGHVPDKEMSASTALVAARAKDDLYRRIAFARALQNHDEQEYAHESAKLIEAEISANSDLVYVPSVSSSAIVIDGALSEPAWQIAARLVFNRNGLVTGYDNGSTYEYPQNAIDPDGRFTVKWLHAGTTLFVGIDADDQYITSADVPADSDGLSHLWIRNTANETILHQATYTFFPNAGTNTTPSAPAGTILSDSSVGNAAFSLKPGNNMPNDASDIDTGYQLELAIDLSQPSAGGYTTTAEQIIIGLRLADMDGTPGETWPWSNGAYGTMMQWRDGLTPDDYTVNRLRLLSADQSSVDDWSIY